MHTSNIKEKSSVQAHISMMQGMISRMANNSANCKLWCITLLAASMALFLDGIAKNMEYCYFITSLFYFLDCFYLGLERQFVSAQNDFVDRINNGETEIEKQIFLPYPINGNRKEECWFIKKTVHFFQQLLQTVKAMISFSTTPFYGAILYAIYYILNHQA